MEYIKNYEQWRNHNNRMVTMLNIGFILSSSDCLFDPFRGDPHTHFQILTILESHFGDKVNLYLIDLRGIERKFAIYHIPECDVYLYSVYTLDYYEILSIVSHLREHYPYAKHIAGGPHTTVFQEECLKIFDSLIIGDGEISIIQTITDVMNSNLKRIYKQTSHIDINLYPYPKRKYLPKSAVARKGLMTLKNTKGYDDILGTTVVFNRGCPYKCHFCAMPEYSSGIRYRDPKLIEEEIEYLKCDYNIEGINLLDEIGIPLGTERATSFLDSIRKTNIIWRGQCRVDGMTPDIVKLARESGCVAMGLGVESISQKSLDIINKKINIKRAKNTISLLKKYNIEVRIYLIIGLPGEPDDIIKQTWDFIEETSPDGVFLSILTIRPGTEIFNNPKNFGIKNLSTDWSRTMHMFGRYDDEIPTLTFEYDEKTPWGKRFTNEKIINNYLELQTKLKDCGLASI